MSRRLFLMCAIVALCFLPVVASAQASPTPGIVPLGKPISDLYNYSLKLVGLCAFVMLVYAGLMYMLPEKWRPERSRDPWEIIRNVIIGLILLFSAYVILNTINPDLVRSPGTATTTTSG